MLTLYTEPYTVLLLWRGKVRAGEKEGNASADGPGFGAWPLRCGHRTGYRCFPERLVLRARPSPHDQKHTASGG